MMEVVRHASASQLNVQSVSTLVPTGYTQLLMDRSAVGVQPANTFVLGALQDTFEKVVRKGVVKKRLILREVLTDGTEGKQVDVIVYGTYAHKVEDILKSVGSSPKQWVIFTKGSIGKFPACGTGEGWCANCLRIGGVGMSEAQVIVVTEFHPPAQTPMQGQVNAMSVASPERSYPSQLAIPELRSSAVGPSNDNRHNRLLVNAKPRNKQKPRKFETINSLKIGLKFDLFAVVNEVVKPPTLTARQSHHMLLGLVDPSCLHEGSQRPDLLLHVFINDKVSNKPLGDLPGGIASGDVILVRDMFTELYQVENKVHGKVYSASQIVKFNFDGDTVTTVTHSNSYALTDVDRNHVLHLRQWWNQVKHLCSDKQQDNGQGQNAENEFEFGEATIAEVNHDMHFSLFCQVLEMRPVSKLNKEIVILRVRDGTLSSVHTQQCNLADATQDLLSQTDAYSSVGSGVVDINVLSPTEDAKLLESGDFVLLKYVHAVNMNPDVSANFQPPLFELLMNDPRCSIRKISVSHSETRKILRRLGYNNPSEAVTDAQESLLQGTKQPLGRSTPVRSPLKPSPNRINTQPLSPQRLHRNKSNTGPAFAHPNTSRMSHLTSVSPVSQREKNPSAHSSPHLSMQTDSLEQAMEGFHTQSDDMGRSAVASQERSPGRKTQSPRLIHSGLELDQDISRIVFPPDLPTSTQRLSSDIHSKGPGSRASGDCSISYSANREDLGLPPISPSLSVASTDHRNVDIHISPAPSLGASDHRITPSQEKTAKRKLSMIEEGPEGTGCETNKTARKFMSRSITTECLGEFTDTTLKEMESNSQPGVLYRVSCIMKSVYIYPDGDLCQKCGSDKLCLHDWVWGLCEKCGSVHSASTLRNMFSERDLSSLSALSCIKCIEDHAEKNTKAETEPKHIDKASSIGALEEQDHPQQAMSSSSSTLKPASSASRSSTPASASKTRPERVSAQEMVASIANGKDKERAKDSEDIEMDPPATVAPVLRLKVGLADPQDGSEVDVLLNGDNAKCFFGVEPTFRWVVRKPERKTVELIWSLLREKKPLQFGVEKLNKRKGSRMYTISNTILRLQD
ncbi:uncharacterized protein LOC122249413 isoform X3 [Penaeus japonicus]|uniref:uncharacterized protein LOC122249413 isoform X3 n=1 Tax=Penaeus japonicus TaxID=27405 RepID=UPI001C71617C|nr:uncharacterized protein LOC122249413 isoform X3 [Penaeus japonicus]